MDRFDEMDTKPTASGQPNGDQPTPGAQPPEPRSSGREEAHSLVPQPSTLSPQPSKSTIRYFGDYVLLGEIAQGGMGVVYRGRQVSLNRPVAVKMIRPDRASTKEAIQRFRTEAEAAAGLEHLNIIPIYEIGEHEGQQYFSMRLVEGHNLAHEIGGKPMPPRRAAQILAAVARAVHHAHQRGVLHRDLKPSNILLEQADSVNPVPIVTDFGLAKLTERRRERSQTGTVLGTLEYMAPEQAVGKSKQLTTATDIYSLGAILFAMLTGRSPFKQEEEEGDLALLKRVNETEPPRPRSLNPACDRDLETICLKCLHKEPRRRYASATELAEELERWWRGEPILARPVRQWERVAKWYRRKPLVAGLATALVAVFLIGFGTALWQWRQTVRARNETSESLQLMQIQRAEELLSRDRAAEAMAYLADVLQTAPLNRVAAERLLSALVQRTWCKPLAKLRYKESVYSISFSLDGFRVLTVSGDMTARVWDAHTGRPLTEPLRYGSNVVSVRFSWDEQRVVTASSDKTARVWDARTGQPLTEPLRHGSNVVSASFSSDGLRVVTACSDKTARVWDARTGQPLTEPLRHGDALRSASFSPDGLRVVTASWDRTVRVWDARTGQPRTEPLRHGSNVVSASFSRDGLRVLTVSSDQTAQVWDAHTGQPLTEPLRYHGSKVAYARFSPDGLRVVTSSWDNTARVWDPSTGQPLTGLLRHGGPVESACFSPDGQRVLTASSDNTARV